jgi:dihydroorotase
MSVSERVSEQGRQGTVFVIRGGDVLDHRGRRRADVLVRDGEIAAVDTTIDVPAGATVLDASGCVVAPGLVDLCARLGEPGREAAETIASGTAAAVRGGFTTVVHHVGGADPVGTVHAVRAIAARDALVRVELAGPILVDGVLAPYAELAATGVRIVSDVECDPPDALTLRRAFEYASPLGLTLSLHAHDRPLARDALMHEGAVSSRMGVRGVPGCAEEIGVATALAMAKLTGGRLHLRTVSTAPAAAAIATSGVATADVAPHHLALTDADCESFDPATRVWPPLRPEPDRAAVAAAGLVVASDHHPHAPEEVDVPFGECPVGARGLETALAIALSTMSIDDAIAALSWRPAAIAGLPGCAVEVGAVADLAVVDPHHAWTLDPTTHSPFAGRTLTGAARHVLVTGRPILNDYALG